MGYEGLCMAMFDQPDLVAAMVERIEKLETEFTRRLVQFDRVKFVWGSDDMGFKTGTMVQADFIRQYVLPCHRKCAEIAHAAGRPYLLHSCGKLDQIMADMIDDVKIDAKHSFEDTIRPMAETKKLWGSKIGLIGGVDVDFLCRADEPAIRRRVRETLEVCLPGGGYCLGTATRWPTTSRWTTTWRCWTKGGSTESDRHRTGEDSSCRDRNRPQCSPR